MAMLLIGFNETQCMGVNFQEADNAIDEIPPEQIPVVKRSDIPPFKLRVSNLTVLSIAFFFF